MATMGLDIGGAETHIVELARELQKEGHDIVIASNGGRFVKEIEETGIRHYTVPMNRRNISCMAKSYILLRKIIKTEKPDVVHAHARIPAFICGVIHRTEKFPFVTTAHWVFKTGGGLKYFTDWGEKTIAVSEDISDYLTVNYGIPKKNIFVTINGIDTDKFSPEVPGDTAAAEFGIDRGLPVISHVSRLDESRALAARRLIEGAEEIEKGVPGVQILIAGGGDRYDELCTMAAEVNGRLGKKCVIMAGPRTDINEIIAVGDVFVGVSRAALEAMACSKPVIVAGNEGYLGLFTEDKLDGAMESNFCCRGCPEVTKDTLALDIAECFALSPEKRSELGEYGRQVIFDHYSVAKMAADCMKAYKAATPKKYSVLMSGYYGFGNTGDEAILQSIIENIGKATGNVSVTVLSSDPRSTAERYGCIAVHRFSPFKVYGAIKHCDALISGGGSLLQDRTSTRSIMYYLFIIQLAEKMGKKVMLYANGIGPVEKKANRRRVKKAVERADTVTLRDGDSMKELRRMGVRREDMHCTIDPVFTLGYIGEGAAQNILAASGVPADKPFTAVSVRNWKDIDGFCGKVAAVCDDIVRKYGHSIVFIAMQTPSDTDVSRRVQAEMKSESFIIGEKLTAVELMGVIGRAGFVLSMRLHSLIFAARMGVPMAGIVYDPKMEYYLKMFGMPAAGKVESFDDRAAFTICSGVIENRGKYTEVLLQKTGEFSKLAAENEKYLMKMLEN